MSRVLVTGGAGFIGSHLCDRLVAQGDRVIVLDDFSAGHLTNLAHLRNDIDIIEDSILNIGAHAAALDGVTRVYHLAALISGYDSLREPERYLEINLHGLCRLIEVIRNRKGMRLIFASSSGVYGRDATTQCQESGVVSPLSVYALTKLAGEQLLAINRALGGLDHVCLRFFNVYGPRQNPNHPYANVVCRFAHAAATGERVQLYGDGKQSRDFVYIDDVIDAIQLVAERSQQTVYNVGTGTDFSIISLLGKINSICGRDVTVQQLPPWPNDIRAISADISRMRDEFGFTARVSIPEGLARTIDYFRKSLA